MASGGGSSSSSEAARRSGSGLGPGTAECNVLLRGFGCAGRDDCAWGFRRRRMLGGIRGVALAIIDIGDAGGGGA